ncbi:hypothetical protein FISHEDRAFT_56737 [Fistulina hepatica ATCC 64428]|uniref:Uncharacterized protein n=1 Tax=Fistulina hepatica ATCC 64428 TaxID=1128425 RepID=A0A0D7AK96_9AGAR|nr:hypothetical protein FISHEDRAFT_56737 [Fistulina hepatica ATCC 64428]
MDSWDVIEAVSASPQCPVTTQLTSTFSTVSHEYGTCTATHLPRKVAKLNFNTSNHTIELPTDSPALNATATAGDIPRGATTQIFVTPSASIVPQIKSSVDAVNATIPQNRPLLACPELPDEMRCPNLTSQIVTLGTSLDAALVTHAATTLNSTWMAIGLLEDSPAHDGNETGTWRIDFSSLSPSAGDYLHNTVLRAAELAQRSPKGFRASVWLIAVFCAAYMIVGLFRLVKVIQDGVNALVVMTIRLLVRCLSFVTRRMLHVAFHLAKIIVNYTIQVIRTLIDLIPLFWRTADWVVFVGFFLVSILEPRFRHYFVVLSYSSHICVTAMTQPLYYLIHACSTFRPISHRFLSHTFRRAVLLLTIIEKSFEGSQPTRLALDICPVSSFDVTMSLDESLDFDIGLNDEAICVYLAALALSTAVNSDKWTYEEFSCDHGLSHTECKIMKICRPLTTRMFFEMTGISVATADGSGGSAAPAQLQTAAAFWPPTHDHQPEKEQQVPSNNSLPIDGKKSTLSPSPSPLLPPPPLPPPPRQIPTGSKLLVVEPVLDMSFARRFHHTKHMAASLSRAAMFTPVYWTLSSDWCLSRLDLLAGMNSVKWWNISISMSQRGKTKFSYLITWQRASRRRRMICRFTHRIPVHGRALISLAGLHTVLRRGPRGRWPPSSTPTLPAGPPPPASQPVVAPRKRRRKPRLNKDGLIAVHSHLTGAGRQERSRPSSLRPLPLGLVRNAIKPVKLLALGVHFCISAKFKELEQVWCDMLTGYPLKNLGQRICQLVSNGGIAQFELRDPNVRRQEFKAGANPFDVPEDWWKVR